MKASMSLNLKRMAPRTLMAASFFSETRRFKVRLDTERYSAVSWGVRSREGKPVVIGNIFPKFS
jgi:hypothetical protein